METFKVAVLEGEKNIVFHEVQKREPDDKQVLVKVDSCAIVLWNKDFIQEL